MYITISRSTQFPFYRRGAGVGGERGCSSSHPRLEDGKRRLHNALSPPLGGKGKASLWEGQERGGLDLVSRNYQLIIYVYAGLGGGGSKAYLPLFPIPEHSGNVHTLYCCAFLRAWRGSCWGKGFFTRPPPKHILEVFSASHYRGRRRNLQPFSHVTAS